MQLAWKPILTSETTNISELVLLQEKLFLERREAELKLKALILDLVHRIDVVEFFGAVVNRRTMGSDIHITNQRIHHGDLMPTFFSSLHQTRSRIQMRVLR